MDLKGRNFLTLKDFTPEEITYLLDLSAELKEKKKKGIPVDKYRGITAVRHLFWPALAVLLLNSPYMNPAVL